jgi:pyruvate kinase
VAVSVPSLTEKDKDDLQFAFKHNIDYVALSFIRSANDIRTLREFMHIHGPKKRNIPIVAKIEKAEAIDDLDAIVQEANAVMVARGDLGVELPTEDVPLLQKMIVRKCNELGKPVIIATQMLESMVDSLRPTRAEASDVANAVLDGADAVMLSAETSIGRYPVQSVAMMSKIIVRTADQKSRLLQFDPEWIPVTHRYDPLTHSACLLANYLKASAIIALTHSGTTAIHLAKFRPPVQIIAVTDSESVIRHLNLVWGVRGVIVENLKRDTDVTFKRIEVKLLKEGYVKRGETVVMLAGIPLFEGHPTNTIKVDRI